MHYVTRPNRDGWAAAVLSAAEQRRSRSPPPCRLERAARARPGRGEDDEESTGGSTSQRRGRVVNANRARHHPADTRNDGLESQPRQPSWSPPACGWSQAVSHPVSTRGRARQRRIPGAPGNQSRRLPDRGRRTRIPENSGGAVGVVQPGSILVDGARSFGPSHATPAS